jgi:threonine dehydrogenase-like Zn-dependent dehydrogenase
MANTMRVARLHAVGEPLRIEEMPLPEVGPNDVLVRIAACGTQDGDHQLIHGKLPLRQLPLVIGHEPAGTVAETGANVRNVKPGDRVFVSPSLSCGQCAECRAGNVNYCPEYAVMGMSYFAPPGKARFERYGDGGFAEYMLIPAGNANPLPDSIPFDQAAKFAFLGVALKACERGGIRPGSSVVVAGASGALGTCAVMCAHVLGATTIVAIARDAGRLERVRRIHPSTVHPFASGADAKLEGMRALLPPKGADVLIDCLPTALEVTQSAIGLLRRGGKAVLIGGVQGPIAVDYRQFMLTEIEVTGSVGMGPGTYPRIVEMVRTGLVDFSGFITHRFPLEQANEAIAAVMAKTGDPLGVVISA